MPNETTGTRAYYLNTLLTWRGALLKQRRSLMARYASMEKTDHPDRRDQGYLLEINEEALMNINDARVATACCCEETPERTHIMKPRITLATLTLLTGFMNVGTVMAGGETVVQPPYSFTQYPWTVMDGPVAQPVYSSTQYLCTDRPEPSREPLAKIVIISDAELTKLFCNQSDPDCAGKLSKWLQEHTEAEAVIGGLVIRHPSPTKLPLGNTDTPKEPIP